MQQTLSLSQTFVFIVPQKGQFWFLLMLKTYAAEVGKKNVSTKTHIAQPPRQLQMWQSWQMKYILCIYIFLQSFKVNSYALKGLKKSAD